MEDIYICISKWNATSLEGINAIMQSLENIISSMVSVANVEEIVNHALLINCKLNFEKWYYKKIDFSVKYFVWSAIWACALGA